MIRYFHKSLHSLETRELSSYQNGSWVYVEKPSSSELEFLVRQFKLERGHLEDALDRNEMPRLEREDDFSYIFVRFAFRTGDNDTDTAPLLFIFSQNILITISLVSLPSLSEFLSGKIEYSTTQRTRLMLLILQQMSKHYDNLISVTSKQIKSIHSRLRGHDISNPDFVVFVSIQDELNDFLASLQPTNSTLRRLLHGGYVPLFADDQDIVGDLLLNNEQAIESCNANIKSIQNIREAYSSISSNNLNRTIKILTIITVMLNIPNLFYQMYGMNVSLPLQNKSWMFGAMTAFVILLLLIAALIGKKRKIF